MKTQNIHKSTIYKSATNPDKDLDKQQCCCFYLQTKAYKRHPTGQPQTIYSSFYSYYNHGHVWFALTATLSSKSHLGQLIVHHDNVHATSVATDAALLTEAITQFLPHQDISLFPLMIKELEIFIWID